MMFSGVRKVFQGTYLASTDHRYSLSKPLSTFSVRVFGDLFVDFTLDKNLESQAPTLVVLTDTTEAYTKFIVKMAFKVNYTIPY